MDYTKSIQPLNLIYFDNSGFQAIRYCQTKPVTYDGVKPGYYTINSEGELFNAHGKFVSPRLINSGYLAYALVTGKENPKYKNVTAHRLVKSTFDPIENEDEYTIDHINMDKQCNKLYNLEWTDQEENNSRKYLAYPNDGTNNYRSTFSQLQLEKIVCGLDNGERYSDILKNIGMEDSKNNRDYIGNIKRGITYVAEVNEIRLNRGSTTNGDECSRVEIK